MRLRYYRSADSRMRMQNALLFSIGNSSRVISHPRRPRGSQSGREKRRDESFHYGRKSPWVPTLTGPFPKIQADADS